MADPELRCYPAVGFVAYAEETGEALRGWRDLHAVAQVDIADEMGVSPSVISDYEGGRRDNPGIDFIAEYVSAVVSVADGGMEPDVEQMAGDPPHTLRGGDEEWGAVPGGVPEDIREAVHAVWEGFERD